MLVARAGNNPDKAVWMAYMEQLVAAGYAEFVMRGNGETEVRLAAGETHLLAETNILRLA